MKVPRAKIPEHIQKKDCDLHSIYGWFSDPVLTHEPVAVAFSGYFRLFKLRPECGFIHDGQMIDTYGPSEIDGTMNTDEMAFQKTYEGRDYPISYRFKKNNGIWIGEYESPRLEGVHPAKAAVSLLEEDAFAIACGKIADRIQEREQFPYLPFRF